MATPAPPVPGSPARQVGSTGVRVIALSVAAAALILTTPSCRSIEIPNPSMHGVPGLLQKHFESSRHPEPRGGACRQEGRVTGVSEIAIEATPCYGYCATYTFIVRADGSAEYTGQANVSFKGHRTGTIDPAAFEAVAEYALDIGFFSALDDSYSCGVTDSETVYVSLVMDGQRRTIRHYAPSLSGPPRLYWLEDLIGLLEEKVKWAAR